MDIDANANAGGISFAVPAAAAARLAQPGTIANYMKTQIT
ncbi:jg901, partial [Pararge aegeria aegeria]